jgi:hypothetical protein
MGRVIGRVGYCHIDDVYFMFLCMGYFEWVSLFFYIDKAWCLHYSFIRIK